MRILIYGYGNPGRQDDALGLLLVDYIEQWALQQKFLFVSTDQSYQLNIEDADKISGYDLVIFCDASKAGIEDVLIEEVIPDMKTDFTMHAVSPSFVLGLCHQICTKQPITYQLHIKGYSWEFMQPPTERSQKNLLKAQTLLTQFLEDNIAKTNSSNSKQR